MDAIWEVKGQKKEKLTTRIRISFGPFILVTFLGLIVMAWTAIALTLFNAIRFYSVNGRLTLITTTEAGIVVLRFIDSTFRHNLPRDSSGENSLGRR
jgi:hypothetical protein